MHALEFFMGGACMHFAYLDSKYLILVLIRLCERAFPSHLDTNLNPHTYYNYPFWNNYVASRSVDDNNL